MELVQLIGNAETDALREMEAAHRLWMDTPIDAENAPAIKAAKDTARAKYLEAKRKAHPTWIIV